MKAEPWRRLSAAAAAGMALGTLGLVGGFGGTRADARVEARTTRSSLRTLIESRRPLYCGGHRRREVALTFDDGPGPYSGELVRRLRQAHAGATFFLVGNRIGRWLAGARAEAAAGEIGDHTWGHHLLPRLKHADAVWQIEHTRREIRLLLRRRTVLFRPPYGAMTRRLRRLLREKGMAEILWSVDSRDYVPGATSASILASVKTGLRPGAIVGLHEIHAQTIAALPSLLAELRRRRLKPVTVTRLLRDDPPSAAQLSAGPYGCARG
jgi:peptidoglycan-N-acetylglucosamine deacetylase